MLIEPIGASAIDAPAKVNLALHVTGRRLDGYHLIETLAVFTRFGDRVSVAPADVDSFAATGAFAAGLPADETNLVLRALAALRRRFPDPAGQPVAIELEKNLPIASGVGGGSSDAAAALRGLARAWRLPLDDDELARIGLSLGADVAMCMAARPLIARGVGDLLSLLPAFPALPMVLVNPGVQVATAEVFRRLERRDNAKLPPLPEQIDFHALRGWLTRTRNDLEEPALAIEPVIGDVLDELGGAGAAFVRMSGSGATCFGLFETAEAAQDARAAIRDRRPGWFVAATASWGSEAEA